MPNLEIGLKTTGADNAASDIRKVGTEVTHAGSAADKIDLDRVTRSTEKATAGMTRMAPPTRNSAAALLMFSQGLEDAQYGLRGVLNNIPPLVMALGGGMGVAGAVSIAAVGISSLVSWLGTASDKADEFGGKISEAVSKAAEEIGNLELKKLDDAREKAESATTAAALLAEKFHDVERAEDSASAAAFTNAEKAISAQTRLANALGLQVDEYEQLMKLHELQQQALDAEAQAEIRAVNRAREDAVHAAWKKSKEIADEEVRIAGLLREKEIQAQILLTLSEQNRVAENARIKRAADSTNNKIAAVGWMAAGNLPAANDLWRKNRGEDEYYDKTAEFRQSSIAAASARMKEIVQQLDAAAKSTETNLAEFDNINKKLNETDAAAVTKIAEVNATLDAQKVFAEVDKLVQTGEQLAKDAGGVSEKIESNNASVKAAQAVIADAVNDGQITAEEHQGVADAMRTLVGQLQLGTAKLNDVNVGIADVIKLQNRLADASAATLQGNAHTEAKVTALEILVKQMMERQSHQ